MMGAQTYSKTEPHLGSTTPDSPPSRFRIRSSFQGDTSNFLNDVYSLDDRANLVKNDVTITLGQNGLLRALAKRLEDSSRSTAKSFERLSSGMRINSAADDPARLAIASSLRSDSRVIAQGIRNINDGISAVNIASSAMSSLRELLDRQRELATQAANGTYSTTQRRAMDTEAQALVAEYNRIVATTKFNGQNLLDGSVSEIGIQVGGTGSSTSRISIGLSDISSPVSATTGDGTFQTAQYAASGGVGGGIWNTYLVDMNNDGKLDIVNGGGAGGLGVALGNGDGTFRSPTYTNLPSSYVSFASFGDINGDGKIDIATGSANDGYATIWLGNGDGTFVNPTTFAAYGTEIRAVTLADFNNDGKIDLAAGDTAGGATTIWLGQGNGTFAARTSAGTREVVGMAAQDINGDGNLDLIFGGKTGVVTALGNGDGTFRSSVTQTALGGWSFNLTTADFNNDSKMDIAATDYSGRVLMLLGNGNGTFNSPLSVAVAGGPTDVKAADLNGDGNIDLVVAAEDSNTISILIGNGSGNFTKISSTVMPGSTGVYETDAVAIGDVNGDGGFDLVIGQDQNNSNYVLLAHTQTTIQELDYSLLTQSGALLAATEIATAQDALSIAQGKLGAAESRLNVALSLSHSNAGTTTSALSRIEDVDVAEETAQLLKGSILQKIGASLLAHATHDAQLILSLLK